jgi:photosystem II stability/assembly factor-like uncharacterized protein
MHRRTAPILVAVCSCLLVPVAHAEPSWEAIPGAPIEPRIDDLHFLDADRGWLATASGRIWHTPDGGDSWDLQYEEEFLYLRSVRFATPERGWVGTLSSDTPLLTTEDGGATWDPVPLPSPVPLGVCGISVPTVDVMVGVGLWAGPPRVVMTTDGGQSYTTRDLSDLAFTLVDAHFTDALTGFVVGSVGSFPTQSRALVLHTDDGGATWETRHEGTRTGEWCWKISFPTEDVGYVSLERFAGPMHVLKTTDGGTTWFDLPFPDHNEQGIGFSTADLGWVGGSENPTFVTTDGGASWTEDPFGESVNRFQFLSPTVGFAGGLTVYRFGESTVDVADASPAIAPRSYGSPNPFRPRTSIHFSLPRAEETTVRVADATGRIVRTLRAGLQAEGTHVVDWNGRDDAGREVPAGFYLYVIRSASVNEVGKLVRVE